MSEEKRIHSIIPLGEMPCRDETIIDAIELGRPTRLRWLARLARALEALTRPTPPAAVIRKRYGFESGLVYSTPQYRIEAGLRLADTPVRMQEQQ